MNIGRILLFFSLWLVVAKSYAVERDTIEQKDSVIVLTYCDSVCISIGIPESGECDSQLLRFVASWLGTPYRYGGKSSSGTDCSGFSGILFRDVYEIDIPRVSGDIAKDAKKIRKMDDLLTGDLVFFHTGRSRGINHVGVYLWDGYFVHSSTKRGVIISRLDEGYYNERFVQGGRYEFTGPR